MKSQTVERSVSGAVRIRSTFGLLGARALNVSDGCVGLLTMMSDRLDVDLVLNVCFETIIEAGCESTFYAPREPGGRRLLWR